jgi:DNA invertase Pin-like site-specific DNA recombinase
MNLTTLNNPAPPIVTLINNKTTVSNITTDDNIYIDEAISGTVNWKKRKIFDIINKMKKDDLLIVPELSRISRNMYETFEIIKLLQDKRCHFIAIKNNIKLDDSLQSKMMLNMYAMFSEVERNLISIRTKEGMKRPEVKEKLKNRKRGKKGIKPNKLDGKDQEIKQLLDNGVKRSEIARKMDVFYAQLNKYIKDKKLVQ